MSEYGSVTQCPHCKTSFHVGPIQLEAANGAVRCGGCLKVFDALEHFIIEQKPLFGGEATEAAATKETEPEPEFFNPRADDDDILADDQELSDVEERDAGAEIASGIASPDEPEPEDSIYQNEMESIYRGYDDDDDDEYEYEETPEKEALDEEHRESEASSEDETIVASADEYQDEADQEISDILKASFAGLEDNLSDASSDTHQPSETESENTWESVVAVRPGSEEEPLLSDLVEPEQAAEEKLAEQLFVGSKNRKAYKKISAPWTICISTLFVALLAQSLYWQAASLREIDFYNRVSINFCVLLPCRKLVLQDLSLLSVTGIVRPSTEYNNSLAVQVELRNRAELSQRFPHIELAFTDLRGEKISLRRFSPQEYLRSETAGRTLLQPFQRIQIEMELYDPGASAISYEFNLLYLN